MLKIINLNKKYGNKQVLNNISMEFACGESTAVVGESGSGKTTLAKIIIGLEKQDSGQVLLNNKELADLKHRSFSQCAEIQYIFQDPYSALESNYTVLKTLKETTAICKRNNYEHISIEEALGYVDENLLDYLNEKVEVLSGGQRQKLCIARSLITNPAIIIADECTSMLDEKSSEEIYGLLNKIKEDKKIILISILHEIDFYKGRWNKIAVIKDGNLLEHKEFKSFYETAETEYGLKLIEAYKYFKDR
jgi:ABC-type dipeptide/oligopeptide/nickel transport system ATPase subunit